MKITIKEKQVRDRANPFSMYNKENFYAAAKDLTKPAFLLWTVIDANNVGFDLLISDSSASKYGISDVYKAKDELLEKNYLKPIGNSSFEFYEVPTLEVRMENLEINNAAERQAAMDYQKETK